MCKLGECTVYYLYEKSEINEMFDSENKMIKFREKYYYKSE